MQATVPEVIVDFTETRAFGRMKPTYLIRNVRVVPAESLWPENERCKGKFVLKGFVVHPNDDEPFHPLDEAINQTRTSLIVKADIEAGTFETLNSIYKVVV